MIIRRLTRPWRSSLQLRVATLTLVVGVVVVTILGGFLSFQVRDGLVDQRIAQLDREAARSANSVATAFGTTTAVSAADVQALIGSLIDPRNNGASSARSTMLASARDVPVPLNDAAWIEGQRDLVTPQLRAEMLESNRQNWQFVLIPASLSESRADEPGVMFAAPVTVGAYGRFGLYTLYSLEPEAQTLAFIQRTLVLGGVVIIALIGTITWLFTRQVVAPVRRASATAARLADGHLEERMSGRGEDEIATLARSFNEMATSLQDQISRMETLTAAQRQFVSDVSHELRTPLTTIRLAGELIYAARHDLDPVASRSAEVLQAQIDRFEELLADLLEISRFDAGAAVLDVEQCRIDGIVAKVIDTANPLAERKGVELSVERSGAEPVADVDPRRIERILRNLVSNAIEHAEGRPVSVLIGANADAVSVVVRDHGIGMSPEEVAHVFDRFWRADPARSRTTGGTGLGLSIALEDARLHAGRLDAWGESGRGASFRLTVPRRAGLPVADPPLPVAPPAELVPLAANGPAADSRTSPAAIPAMTDDGAGGQVGDGARADDGLPVDAIRGLDGVEV
jgi:two-component system sensor histidine kinase MtrB